MTTTALAETDTRTTTTAMSTRKQYEWESGPIPIITTPFYQTGATDQYTHAASEMALVHNCIIRAINSIYIQAPHMPVTEYRHFVKYCLATHEGLTAHHDGEEEIFFPEIERMTGEHGLMAPSISQHHAFAKGFTAWANWLKSIEARKNNFSPDMCRSLMDDFIPPLAAHLHDEIAFVLSLARFGSKLDLRALGKKEGDLVMARLSKTKVLPVFMLNHDAEFEGGWHAFPPVPRIVRWVLRSVFGRWEAKWWVFSTVGYDGRARALKYVEK